MSSLQRVLLTMRLNGTLCLVCSPASLCHCLRKRREVLDLLRSFFLFCCVSCTVAPLRCGAGVPTSLNSAMASFQVSCERLPCVSIAVHRLLNALWSLHAPSLSLPLPLCLSVCLSVCLPACLSLSHLKHVCRLLETCNTGPGDGTAASLEQGTQHVLDLLWIPVGIFWIISTCLCICASFTMFSVFCIVCVWRYSGHCISAGTSTFMSMCRCCETSVICCTFWLVLLMNCTCGNFSADRKCNVGLVMNQQRTSVKLLHHHEDCAEKESLHPEK